MTFVPHKGAPRIGESTSQSANRQEIVIKVDFTTHIETIKVDAANPGNIKSVKVDKRFHKYGKHGEFH